MKNAVQYLKILLIGIIIISCKNTAKNSTNNSLNIEKVKWLIGQWTDSTKDGITTENWTILDDTTFNGKRYIVKNNDTTMFENLQLQQINSVLFFIAIIEDLNEEKSIKFILKPQSFDSELIFENPEYEYPQKIIYTKVNNDTIIAELSGMFMGKQNSVKYPMHRTNVQKQKM